MATAALASIAFRAEPTPAAVAAASQAAVATGDEKLSEVDVRTNLRGAMESVDGWHFPGFTAGGEMLVTVASDVIAGRGRLFWVNARTGKVSHSVPTGALLVRDMALSPDGRTLVTLDDFMAKVDEPDYGPNATVHVLKVFDSANLKLRKTIDVGAGQTVFGVTFAPGQAERTVVSLSVRPSAPDQARSVNRLEFWDVQKGVRYRKGVACTSDNWMVHMLFAPGGRVVAIQQPQGLEGESQGVDVVDLPTGRVLWHIERGDDDPPMAPFFFLSADALAYVDGDKVYHLSSRKVTPLGLGVSGLRGVAGIPEHPGLAFLESKVGLELWDLNRKRSIKRWPQMRRVGMKAGVVRLSVDQAVMAVVTAPNAGWDDEGAYQHPVIHFWRFSPTLLRP